MIKLLHLELYDTCNHCPYLHGATQGGYFCANPDSLEFNILVEQKDGIPVMPFWCPLPTWVEGDKF